jgi:hypothetical protein
MSIPSPFFADDFEPLSLSNGIEVRFLLCEEVDEIASAKREFYFLFALSRANGS